MKKILLTLTLIPLLLSAVWLLVPKAELWRGVSFSRCYYDCEGKLLRVTLADDQRYRVFTPLEEISPLAVAAALLHEDRWFNWHFGFNPVALGRAALNEMFGFHRRVGASTVSMQLARIRYRLNTRTVSGKFFQILRALQIELTHSKREILTAYLNQISYGRNIEGIGAASLVYYGKPAANLTLAEALTLSVIPQSPARRAPRADNQELLQARKRLFARWVARHPRDADYEPTLDMALQVGAPRDLPFLAPHFTDWLERTNREPRTVTTLSLTAQRAVENCVAKYVEQQRGSGVRNASALLVSLDTLGVVAAVGSADYFNADIDGQVNGATMRRSPGSTLKPLLYALAMDEGLIQPLTLLADAPGSFGEYNPENYDRGFAGPIHAATALQQSRNIPAVWLLSRLKKQSLHQLLTAADVRHLKPESHYGLTLALGSAEVSPAELAQLYAMLANGGKFRPLTFSVEQNVSRRDAEARRFFNTNKLRVSASLREPSSHSLQLLSPEACFLVLDILQQTARPGAIRSAGLREVSGSVAWKTGTSWSYRDAWSVAVFDRYALVVWVGNFSGESNGQFVGRRTAAPLMFSIIDAVRARGATSPSASWHDPHGLNLTRVDLCSISGAPANRHCPLTLKGWFIPGVSPIAPCAVHQAVWLNPRTGLRVKNREQVPNARQEIFEVWSSDMQALFKQAGLPRRQPPPFESQRRVATPAADSHTPVIKSPRENVTYTLPLNVSASGRQIILQASAAADAQSLYWFVDSVFIGRCQPEETLSWSPTAGEHQVTVSDEHGRTAARKITVEAAQ